MSELTKLIGESIINRRESLNLTQGELAKLAETSVATISRYESGDAGISKDAIGKIAKALNINELDLVNSKKNPTPLRVVESTDQMVERVKKGLLLLEWITPETADEILKSPKEIKRMLAEVVEDWLILPDDEKADLVNSAATYAADLRKSGVIQSRKARA